LSPVIENSYAAVDWAPAPGAERWIVVSGQTSDADIVRAIASIASYSRNIGVRSSLRETTSAIAETPSFVVGGGLLLRTGDFMVAPSCCCGLEGWREWYAVKKGGQSPWLGHDPMPWIDCSGDLAVAWEDEKHRRSATVTYEAIRIALDQAEHDLAQFVERIRAWGSRHDADPRLADHLKAVFHI